jgi:hypothetical protein
MRSLVRVLKLFLVCVYLLLRMLVSMLVMFAAYTGDWGISIGMGIVAAWLFVKSDAVREWAEKI